MRKNTELQGFGLTGLAATLIWRSFHPAEPRTLEAIVPYSSHFGAAGVATFVGIGLTVAAYRGSDIGMRAFSIMAGIAWAWVTAAMIVALHEISPITAVAITLMAMSIRGAYGLPHRE